MSSPARRAACWPSELEDCRRRCFRGRSLLGAPAAIRDALRVASDDVLVDDIARGGADDADPEIVRGIGKTIAGRAIQPDPAVVAGNSNTAAGARRPIRSEPR